MMLHSMMEGPGGWIRNVPLGSHDARHGGTPASMDALEDAFGRTRWATRFGTRWAGRSVEGRTVFEHADPGANPRQGFSNGLPPVIHGDGHRMDVTFTEASKPET